MVLLAYKILYKPDIRLEGYKSGDAAHATADGEAAKENSQEVSESTKSGCAVEAVQITLVRLY